MADQFGTYYVATADGEVWDFGLTGRPTEMYHPGVRLNAQGVGMAESPASR